MLRTWEPLLVPGLLQTPDYARALFLAWHAADSDDQGGGGGGGGGGPAREAWLTA